MSANTDLGTELQAQTRWLRALARGLVGDGGADDLVQDTFAQALAHPPDTDRPLRPWLRRVATNMARMGWRSGQRRRAREDRLAVERDTSSPQLDDALARAGLHRDLVDAVLALDDPYRQTVLLRFVEDLSAAEIARRQGIPAATVRSRLKRGLDHLRIELDRRHGDRATWTRALMPLTVPTTAAQGAALATGVLLMKVTLASVAAAGIAALAIVTWPDDEPAQAGSRAVTPANAGSPSDSGPALTKTSRNTPVKRFDSASDRQRFAATLAAVRARRGRYRRQLAPRTSDDTAPALAQPPSLDREYIQDRIRDVVPLIKECYEMAIEQDPTTSLEGKLVVNFTIDAEEEVGGYVAEAELADPEAALGQAIGECVTETIYSIEFEPPEGGGQMTVSYPFVFRGQ
jgi:RNA polymerase sigma-70 factor (ECF subfamily)